MLPNSKIVGKNIIKELLSLSNGDYQLAYKLSERHILVEGTSRMNVKLAAQLFSNTVANYLLRRNWFIRFFQLQRCNIHTIFILCFKKIIKICSLLIIGSRMY